MVGGESARRRRDSAIRRPPVAGERRPTSRSRPIAPALIRPVSRQRHYARGHGSSNANLLPVARSIPERPKQHTEAGFWVCCHIRRPRQSRSETAGSVSSSDAEHIERDYETLKQKTKYASWIQLEARLRDPSDSHPELQDLLYRSAAATCFRSNPEAAKAGEPAIRWRRSIGIWI